MSFGERVLAGLKTIVLIEKRSNALAESLNGVKTKVETGLADHEKRLVRLETMVEITRPDGGGLSIARKPTET